MRGGNGAEEEEMSDTEKRLLREALLKAKAEITHLERVLLDELTENDELGSEFTYVAVLTAENEKLRSALRGLMIESMGFVSLVSEQPEVTGWINIYCMENKIDLAKAALGEDAK